jgi:Fe/S biogenesis protein NfuA
MKTMEEIQQMLDETVNVLLANHNGKAEIVTIDLNRVAGVVMSGGCQGCAGAKYTLNLIVSNKIKEYDPTIILVVDVTDHTDKTSAYYKD